MVLMYVRLILSLAFFGTSSSSSSISDNFDVEPYLCTVHDTFVETYARMAIASSIITVLKYINILKSINVFQVIK